MNPALRPTIAPRPRGLRSEVGLAEVEQLMLQACAGERLDRLGNILVDHLGTGGKRLRARLALAAVEALGGQREQALAWAAACELLHNATLLHDDVQDGDRLRRGRPAAWVKHGVEQAMNAGDLMLMLPYVVTDRLDVPDGLKWQLCRTLARGAEQVARGQSAELALLRSRRLDWESYARSVEGKTAALFALPVHGAALIAGRDPEEAEALAEPFRRVGLLFQIQDDVLDLYGDKGRELIGSDLYEGKVSALVVEHLRLHPGERDELVALLAAPREQTPPAQVDRLVHRFRTGGALLAVWARMRAIEESIDEAPILADLPRLSAVALDLCARAVAPIAHTAPRQILG